METSSDKSSLQLQREIDQDRQRLGERINAIQERMSPGQLVDEVIAYAKNSGGSEFVGNLGRALKEKSASGGADGRRSRLAYGQRHAFIGDGVQRPQPSRDYDLYPVQGPVRRLGPPTSVGGVR